MADKSKKSREEILRMTRKRAIEMLQLCEETEEGKISGEEFEKRISKIEIIGGGPTLRGG